MGKPFGKSILREKNKEYLDWYSRGSDNGEIKNQQMQ
jgi:DNA-binding CsgD family transcriptional regulator